MERTDILKITDPIQLFEGTEQDIKSIYYNLSQQWHPDKNKDSNSDVFIHITKLYKNAIQLVQNSYTKTLSKNIIEFKCKTGKIIKIKYLKIHRKQYYQMIIANNHVIYIFDENFKSLYDNFILSVKRLHNGAKLKDKFDKFFPTIDSTFETVNNKYGITLLNSNKLIPLNDILTFYNNKVPIKHVAWITNSLYNIVCYFKFHNICHNGILSENYFISCQDHYGILMGGWEHSLGLSSSLKTTDKNIYKVLPNSIKNNKISSSIIDLESIKALTRELLGDRYGSKLNQSYPEYSQIMSFLKLPSNSDPVIDYQNWEYILSKSFGPRKFIQMNCDFNTVYCKGE